MCEVIKNPKDVKKYQKVFEEIIQDNTERYEKIRITFNPGCEIRDVYWSSLFWSTSRIYTKKEDEEERELRYKNWFGITEKEPNRELELDVEINFSLCGGNTSGKFIKDGDNIFVVHTGSIGKDKKDSMEHFWKYYKGNCFIKGKLALIGELPQDEKKEKYSEFNKQVMEFIKEVKRIKKIPKGVTPISKAKASKAKKINKPNPDNVQSDKVLQLVSHIRRLINEINEYREKNRKPPIFIDKNLSPLWTNIEEPCTSEDKKGFVVFILKLYILIYETTRVETKKTRKEEKHFYDFLLPDKFLEKGTKTREFINIVGSLRHRYAHKPPEYKVPIKTMSYADILEKLLKNKNKEENYTIMQIESLKRFEEAMKELLEIVKNDGKIIP